MAILRRSANPRSRRAAKPLVTVAPSLAAVEADRPAMRARSLYLASVSELADGTVRAVWAPGRHHEITALPVD